MGMNYACVLLELVRNVLVDEKVLNICLAELRRATKTGRIYNISFKYLIYFFFNIETVFETFYSFLSHSEQANVRQLSAKSSQKFSLSNDQLIIFFEQCF